MEITNNLKKPFETVYMIVFGFILTEHTKNMMKSFGKGDSYFILGLAVFILLLVSILETALDFSLKKDKIPNIEVTPSMLRYFLWFAQFLPFYYLVNSLEFVDNSKPICLQISKSLMFIYLLYASINLIKLVFEYREKDTNKRPFEQHFEWHMFLYLDLAGLFLVYNMYFPINTNTARLTLSALIITSLVAYILYWKKYYLKTIWGKND